MTTAHADQRRLDDLFARFGPVVHISDIDACGVARTSVRRLEVQDEIVRIGKSAFARAESWSTADPWSRFRLQALGFALCSGPETYLAGWGAALVHGLPVLGSPPRLPTAVRPGDPHRSPNRTVHGRTRFGFLPGSCQQHRDRIRVVSPEFTVVDIARHGSRADGLVAADAAVRAGASRDAMRWLVGRMTTYPGIDIASWSVKYADPHSESPVETVGRLAFLLCERQPPQSNVWISKSINRFRVDHLVPGTGVVLEADGAVKYNMRDDAAAVVHHQNRREELLRAWGFEVVRYTYAEALNRPEFLIQRVDRAIARMSGRPISAEIHPADAVWSVPPKDRVGPVRAATG